MAPDQTSARRTAAVVLGSVAALGGTSGALAQTARHPSSTDTQRRQSRRAERLPAGERALLSSVFGALSAQAPAIAEPVLAAAVADGTITQAQQDRFLARLGSAEPRDAGSWRPTPRANAVFQEALAAIRAALPRVAGPLVASALADGSITQAQATRLSDRFDAGARIGFGLVMRKVRTLGETRLP